MSKNAKHEAAESSPVAENDPVLRANEPAAEWRHFESVKLWGPNPRKNDAAAKDLAQTIKRLGFGSACLTWLDPELGADVYIAGNTRAKAVGILVREFKRAKPEELEKWHPLARSVAKTELIPCRSRNDLSRREATLMALADNKQNELADWDDTKLAPLLSEFSLDEAKLSGWDEKEIEKLGLQLLSGTVDESKDAEPQMERADELAKEWGTKLGQLWKCGEHLVLCGDSADVECVKRVMGTDRASLVFTDPPYGVSIGKKNRMLNSVQKAGLVLADIEDDDLKPSDLKAKIQPAFDSIKSFVMADDCTVFVTSPQGGDLMMMMMMMRDAGMQARHVVIWDKGQPTFSMGRLDYDYEHEPILITWGKRHKRPMLGEHKTSIWRIPKPRSSKEHPTMKPVALVVNALLNNSEAGDIAYDAYSGSGTTLLACEQTGRRARVIELMPGYVAVCLQRYLDATGNRPELLAV
jgi:DNA modification methylase